MNINGNSQNMKLSEVVWRFAA